MNKMSSAPIKNAARRRAAGLAGHAAPGAFRGLAAFTFLAAAASQAMALPTECKVEQAAPVVAAADPAVVAGADEFMGKFCRGCHGPGEIFQNSFNAGELQSIATNAAFVAPGDRQNSVLYKVVASGRMPYSTSGGKPSEQEVEALGKWIDSLQGAAAPVEQAEVERQRDVISWKDFARAAADDLGELRDADRKFIRYFSYRHMFNGQLPCEEEADFAKRMELYKAGFHKFLNSVSLGNSLVVPEPVEGTKELLVRVDIRDLGWDEKKWETLVSQYPYGYEPDSDPILASLSDQTATKLPIMRTDWFTANASRPENYHMLLELGENISELEKRIGVDAKQNIDRGKIIRAAFTEGESGVSDHNRLIERHDAVGGGYYWKSYDFAGSTGKQDLVRHPHGPPENGPLAEDLVSFEHDGGEMIFSLPNGLQGYYLSTHTGERLNRGPASIVSFRNRPVGKGVEIINGRSCFNCHADGIIAKRDMVRERIERSPVFTIGQQELLLAMYVEQAELDKIYDRDRTRFITALSAVGATEKAPDGTLKSRGGPNGEEIVTWFADLYEGDLDFDAVAAEFDMTPEDFKTAIRRIDDIESRRLADDWVANLEAGVKVTRFEVEQQFPKIVKALLDLDPLDNKATQEAVAAVEKKQEERKKKEEGADTSKLELTMKVDHTDVYVDEKLSFEVTANKSCELQVFYIELDGNVEVIPTEMIGDPFLEAGKPRRIPDPATGDLVFDSAAKNETLLLFCRVGGLGDQRLDAKKAKELAKSSGEPLSRGLAVKLIERRDRQEREEPSSTGQSAIHVVTFNVFNR
jgi:hypothetical protein